MSRLIGPGTAAGLFSNGGKRRMDVWVAMIMLTAIGVVALYDLVVPTLFPGSDSVSSAIWAWSSTYPMLPFACGVVVGHLFWHR